MAILYVAADADELKPFAAKLLNPRKLNWPIRYATEGILDGRRILLAANGAGPRLAANALEVAIRAVTVADLSASRLEAVVSTGFCGALVPALQLTDIVVGTEVLDQATGDTYPTATLELLGKPVHSGRVVSQDQVANTAADKSKLARTGALAVDMEAAGVAARAARAGLPFLCVKAVSDLAGETFNFDLNAMRTSTGEISRGKIGIHTLTHPWLIPELLRLRKQAQSAAESLGDFLVSCRIQFGSTREEPPVLVPE